MCSRINKWICMLLVDLRVYDKLQSLLIQKSSYLVNLQLFHLFHKHRLLYILHLEFVHIDNKTYYNPPLKNYNLSLFNLQPCTSDTNHSFVFVTKSSYFIGIYL